MDKKILFILLVLFMITVVPQIYSYDPYVYEFLNSSDDVVTWIGGENGYINATGNITTHDKFCIADTCVSNWLTSLDDYFLRLDGLFSMTGNLLLTDDSYIKIGDVTTGTITENRLFTEGTIVSHSGFSSKNTGDEPYLKIYDTESVTTKSGLNGEFDIDTNIFCDYTANNFAAGDAQKPSLTLTITNGTHIGAIAQIITYVNSSCVALKNNPGWDNTDVIDSKWNLKTGLVVDFNDGNSYRFVVGDDSRAWFRIGIPNGTGFTGASIFDVAGVDQHQALTIDVDSKNFDGIVGQNIYMYSSTGTTDISSSAISLEGDATGFNNSKLHFIDINLIGKGNNNDVDVLHITGEVSHIIHVGSADDLTNAYVENVDETVNFNTEGAGATLFENNNDYVYIGGCGGDGLSCNFTAISFALSTYSNRNLNLEYYYCDNTETWQTLGSVTDTTNGMRISGTIAFVNPSDRGVCNKEFDGTPFANTSKVAYIALKRTRNWVQTEPIESLVTIGGSQELMFLQNDLMKLEGSNGGPVTCSANYAGAWYYDSSAIELLWCDGSAWTAFATTTSPITTHNLLGGLQGGSAAEYYHLDATEFGYLDGQNQALKTTDDVTFATVDTGQGANELYAILGDFATTAPITGGANNVLYGTDGTKFTIAMPVATTSADGYLSQTDWDTFNNKADSDTTYSAGSGIALTGTTFSVAGGTALTQDASGLSVTADGITDTQLEYNTGQHLTTASSPAFLGLTVDTDTLVVDDTNDRVGINIAPAASLHVYNSGAGDAIFQVGTGDGGSDINIDFGYNGYGWYWKYLGSGSGDNNELQLWSEGSGGTDQQAYGIKQSGIMSFKKAVEVIGTLDAPTVNTGQGDNELYAMNQDVETSDNVIFADGRFNGDLTVLGTVTVKDIESTNQTVNTTISLIDPTTGDTNTFFTGEDGEDSYFNTGNVGIGTSTPTHTLEVGDLETNSLISTFGVKSDISHLGIFIEENSGTETWQLGVDADGDLNFHDSGSGTPSVTFQDGGNVGIGTASPDNILHVEDSNPGGRSIVRFKNDGTTTGTSSSIVLTTLTSTAGTIASSVIESEAEDDAGNSALAFSTPKLGTAYERMRIDSGGNVGIGTTSPTEKLEVVGTVTATAFVGDGSGLTNLPGGSGGIWTNVSGTATYDGDVNITGNMTTNINQCYAWNGLPGAMCNNGTHITIGGFS